MSLIAEALRAREVRESQEEQARRQNLRAALIDIATRDLAGKISGDDSATVAEIVDELDLSQAAYEQLLQSIREVRDLDAKLQEATAAADERPAAKAEVAFAEHLAKVLVAAARRKLADANTAAQRAREFAARLEVIRTANPGLFGDDCRPVDVVRNLKGYEPLPAAAVQACKVCGSEYSATDFPGLCGRDCWVHVRDHGADLVLIRKLTKTQVGKLLARTE